MLAIDKSILNNMTDLSCSNKEIFGSLEALSYWTTGTSKDKDYRRNIGNVSYVGHHFPIPGINKINCPRLYNLSSGHRASNIKQAFFKGGNKN